MQTLLLNYIMENRSQKMPNAYIGNEENVVRFIADGFRSLLRLWPTPYDVFKLVKPILITNKNAAALDYPLSPANACLVNVFLFIAAAIDNYALTPYLKADDGIEYKKDIEKVIEIVRKYNNYNDRNLTNATFFTDFLNRVISVDRIYTNVDVKALFDCIDRAERIENRNHDTLFDIKLVKKSFEKGTVSKCDEDDNLIKFLSLVPSDILIMQILKSKDNNISQLKSEKHINFIRNVFNTQNSKFKNDNNEYLPDLSTSCNYDANKNNIVNLIFKRFDNNSFENMDILWDLIDVEAMIKDKETNDVYLFEVVNNLISHLNTHKLILSFVQDGKLNEDNMEIAFILTICKFLSKCSEKIKALQIHSFDETKNDIYVCLRACIGEIAISTDAKILSATVDTISCMCDLTDSDKKLELAMLLVQKLEHGTKKNTKKKVILPQFQRKILSLLITGAAANLSDPKNINGILQLFKLCTTVLCQGCSSNSNDTDFNQGDVTVLDNSCMLLTKCLAFIHTNVFLTYIADDVVDFLWNNCTNLIRGEILATIVSLTNTFSDQIVILLTHTLETRAASDILFWQPYLPTILVLFSKTIESNANNTLYSI